MDFEKNFQTLIMVDTNPGGTASMARLAKGISSFSPSNNDDTDDTAYLDGDGGKDTEVTGMQLQYDFSGHRTRTDAAQNYIAGLKLEVGDSRRTTATIYHIDGSGETGDCTVTDIVDGGGDANAKGEFSCTLMFNGKPTKIDKAAADALGASYAAGTTSGTTTATATPGTGNSLYYVLTDAEQTEYANAYEDGQGLTAYTSGAEIAATAGQYLNVYEITEYKRITKFDSHELQASEIAS